ncbi:MAG: translocation/assembly module TamB domain-containing protein [Flavobacteriales bacterium]
MLEIFRWFLSLFLFLLKGAFKFLGYSTLIALLIVGGILIVINTPTIQTKIAQLTLTKLNESFGTMLLVDSVDVDFLGDIQLYHVKAIDDHKNTLISIPHVKWQIDLLHLFLNPKNIKIKKLVLDQPKVFITTYRGDRTSNMNRFIDKFSDKNTTTYSKTLFKSNFEVKRGHLQISDQNLKEKDTLILTVNPLDAWIENFRMKGHTIEAHIPSIKSTGRLKKKDFRIDELSTNLTFTTNHLQAYNLKLQTSRSTIKGNIALHYNQPKDMAKFIDKIYIKTEFEKGSHLGFEDLKLFINNWDSKAVVALQGKIYGRLGNQLTLSDIHLESGKNKIQANQIVLSHITERRGFKIVQKKDGIIESSYTAATALLPSFISRKIPVFLKDYGNMRYYGAMTITSETITAEGNLSSSAIGTVNTDIQLDNYTRKVPQYKGAISATNIDLSILTKNKNLQSIGGTFHFEGKGFSLNTLQLQLIGTFNQLTLYNRKINKVQVDGRIGQKSFEGQLVIEDPKVKLDFDGKVNFTPKKWLVQAKIKIEYIHLKAMELSEREKSFLNTNLEINVQGTDIDHLQGNIYITNTTYETSKKKFNFSEISIESKILGKKDREITLSAPEMAQGSFRGNFKRFELTKLLENGVNRVLNEKNYHSVTPNQSLTFDLILTQRFIELFEEKVKILSDSHLQGQLTNDALNLDIEIQKVQINEHTIQNAHLNINTSSEKNITFKIENVIIQGISFKNINLTTKQKNDILLINTRFLATLAGTEQEVDLNFYKSGGWNSKESTFVIVLQRSRITINGYDWWINDQNNHHSNLVKIDLKKKRYTIDKLTFTSETQNLTVSTEIIGNNYKMAQGTFDQVQLKQPIPTKEEGLIIDGVAHGNFFIENSGDDLNPKIDMKVNQLVINDIVLGDLNINTSYNEKNKLYQLNITLKNEQIDILTVVGNIDNTSSKKAQLNLDISTKNLPIKFLQAFLGNIFSKIRGTAEGNIKVTGDFDRPIYQGELRLKKVGMKVNYLNTDYEFIGIPSLLINPETFILKDFRFKDTQYNTQGYISGAILNEKFTKWTLALSIDTKNILALNTTSIQNNLFYGTIFANGKIEISGEANNLDISIREGKTTGFSQLFINTKGSQSMTENNRFIHFLNLNTQDSTELINSPPKQHKNKNIQKGLSISIETDINENAKVHLILDPYSDNFIQAKGTGNISFKMRSGGNIEMTGKYNTTKGSYHFSSEQIPFLKLNKQFQIKPGGSITWTGSATNANLNLTAFYPKSVSNVGEYINLPNLSRVPQNILTELKINIYGQLSLPKLELNIDFPNISESIKQQLTQKLNTQDEKLIQFGSILLLGKFFLNTKNIGSGLWTYSTYDLALKQLGNILSSINDALNVNFEYIEGNRDTNSSSGFRSSISYNINRRFSIKSIVGVPFNTVKKQRSPFTGEIQLDMDISQQTDKSLKLTLFSRPNTFGRENIQSTKFSSQNYGVGVIYTTSFNSLKKWDIPFKTKRDDSKKQFR